MDIYDESFDNEDDSLNPEEEGFLSGYRDAYNDSENEDGN